MFLVIWHDGSGEELGRVGAGDRTQVQVKIRATISRQLFGIGTAYELACPDEDRAWLSDFIDGEMASLANMIPATLEP